MDISVDAPPLERFLAATEQLKSVRVRLVELGRIRAGAVVEMRRSGLSLQAIASLTGLTPGRVQELARSGGWKPGEGGATAGRRDLEKLAGDAVRIILTLRKPADPRTGPAWMPRSAQVAQAYAESGVTDAYTALAELSVAISQDRAVEGLFDFHRQVLDDLHDKIVQTMSGHAKRTSIG